jgi:hypothetical protein
VLHTMFERPNVKPLVRVLRIIDEDELDKAVYDQDKDVGPILASIRKDCEPLLLPSTGGKDHYHFCVHEAACRNETQLWAKCVTACTKMPKEEAKQKAPQCKELKEGVERCAVDVSERILRAASRDKFF